MEIDLGSFLLGIAAGVFLGAAITWLTIWRMLQ